MKMPERTKSILLVLVVAAFLAYLGINVKGSPHPEQIMLLETAGAACPGSVSELLHGYPGVVGIASAAGTGEYHVGIGRGTSTDAVRRKLLDGGVPATVVRTVSPVEYRRIYGHYFRAGTFVSCKGGCGK